MSEFSSLSISLFVVLICISKTYSDNQRPIIGIVCHEEEFQNKTFIGASYVKAVEAAGARVAPIFLYRDMDYYRHMVMSLNGVLFQGGNAKYDVKGGYFETGAKIFSIVRKINYHGDHFPILGVCLGMEFLSIYSNNMDTINTLDVCDMNDVMLPLYFTPTFRNSSLFGRASEQIIDILSNQNVTPNYHKYCLRPETKLRHPWHILSLNQDHKGKKFVSSMETSGPMAALMFHPEKNAYEWGKVNPSYEDALLASRHFYDWLVIEARKNNHSFQSKAEELRSLIYNYCPIYFGYNNTLYEQIYIFDH